MTYIIKTIGSQEIRMLIVPSSSPEIPNLLGFDITSLEWRRSKWWGWDLQNRQRWCIADNWIGDTWDTGNQGRKRELGIRVWNWCSKDCKGESRQCDEGLGHDVGGLFFGVEVLISVQIEEVNEFEME